MPQFPRYLQMPFVALRMRYCAKQTQCESASESERRPHTACSYLFPRRSGEVSGCGLGNDLNSLGEYVPRTTFSLDVARVCRVCFEFAAQAPHLHIDAAVIHLVVVQPREVK